MLETLREALPLARVEYLTYTRFAPALRAHPACDAIHTLPPKAGPRTTLALVRRLRRSRIDWCFDTLGNPRSALLVALAAPRHSVGPARGLRSRLYEHRARPDPGERSAVRHQLDLLTPLLGQVETRHTSLFVEPAEREEIARRLDFEPGAELVLIHPGATRPDRAWPIDRWPALIASLQEERPGAQVRVITQPGWEAAAESVVQGSHGDVKRIPPLDLRSLMALLAWTSLYVGNDGGILHTAVALRVPTVGIFGPTEKEAWFPYTSWGPYRAVQRLGLSSAAGRSGPHRFPDAAVAEVLDAVRAVGALGGRHGRGSG
jgi:ADP-heptose:LPS heptosyltransferase